MGKLILDLFKPVPSDQTAISAGVQVCRSHVRIYHQSVSKIEKVKSPSHLILLYNQAFTAT